MLPQFPVQIPLADSENLDVCEKQNLISRFPTNSPGEAIDPKEEHGA